MRFVGLVWSNQASTAAVEDWLCRGAVLDMFSVSAWQLRKLKETPQNLRQRCAFA